MRHYLSSNISLIAIYISFIALMVTGCENPVGTVAVDPLRFTPDEVNLVNLQADKSVKMTIRNLSEDTLSVTQVEFTNTNSMTISGEFPAVIPVGEAITRFIEFDFSKFDGESDVKMRVHHTAGGNPQEVKVLTPDKWIVDPVSDKADATYAVRYEPGLNRIVYYTESNKQNELGYIDAATGEANTLVTTNEELVAVDVSRRYGEILYYIRESATESDIYRKSFNPEEPAIQLTDTTARNIPVGYSPDQSEILFSSNRDGDFEILTMNRNGRITRSYTSNSFDDEPVVYSPNGRYIFYNSTRRGKKDIYRVNADDGTDEKNLTANDALDEVVDVSPDNERLLFYSDRGGRREIYIMTLDGGQVKQLTENTRLDYPVGFSPEGDLVLFYSDRHSHYDVFTVPTYGGEQTRVTVNEYEDLPVDFLGEKETILFNSNRDGKYSIYTASLK